MITFKSEHERRIGRRDKYLRRAKRRIGKAMAELLLASLDFKAAEMVARNMGDESYEEEMRQQADQMVNTAGKLTRIAAFIGWV